MSCAVLTNIYPILWTAFKFFHYWTHKRVYAFKGCFVMQATRWLRWFGRNISVLLLLNSFFVVVLFFMFLLSYPCLLFVLSLSLSVSVCLFSWLSVPFSGFHLGQHPDVTSCLVCPLRSFQASLLCTGQPQSTTWRPFWCCWRMEPTETCRTTRWASRFTIRLQRHLTAGSFSAPIPIGLRYVYGSKTWSVSASVKKEMLNFF